MSVPSLLGISRYSSAKIVKYTCSLSVELHTSQICKSDRECGRRRYCDLHYGSCEREKDVTGLCREDSHCKRGLECIWGRCREQITPPDSGNC